MNQGERKLCEFFRGMSGSFYQGLWQAIFKADENNLEKLRIGFPEEVEAKKRYSVEEGYWDKLKKEYYEVK